MDDNPILRESARLLNKLHLLSAFFEDEMVYKIYLRTQVIHRLYETNPELDINKLELFQVSSLLAENYKKITAINFLQNIAGFDAQANILKTMLNADII